MNGLATVTALRSAFDALIGIAAPELAAPVLQRALRDLLEEPVSTAQEPATPISPRAAKQKWRGDIAAWGPLREAILTTLAARNMSRRELAAAVKINPTTLKPCLTPSGGAPSKANIAKLRRWLRETEARADGAAENGHDSGGLAAPGEDVIAASGGSPHELTTAQREQLAGFRALDGQRARNEAGVRMAELDAAIAGERLAPETISRLAGFLEQQTAAPPRP